MKQNQAKINKINNINNYILIGLLLLCIYKNSPNFDIGKPPPMPLPKLITPFNLNIPSKLFSFFFNFIIGIIIFLIVMCKSRFFCKDYGIIDMTNEKDIYYFKNLRVDPLYKNSNKIPDNINLNKINNSNPVETENTDSKNKDNCVNNNKDDFINSDKDDFINSDNSDNNNDSSNSSITSSDEDTIIVSDINRKDKHILKDINNNINETINKKGKNKKKKNSL